VLRSRAAGFFVLSESGGRFCGGFFLGALGILLGGFGFLFLVVGQKGHDFIMFALVDGLALIVRLAVNLDDLGLLIVGNPAYLAPRLRQSSFTRRLGVGGLFFGGAGREQSSKHDHHRYRSNSHPHERPPLVKSWRI